MTDEERETVIQFDDAGEMATIYTCHKWLANSLIRRKLKPISEDINGNRVVAWHFEVPKSWIHVRPPRKGGGGNAEALRRARMTRLASKVSAHAEKSEVT